MKNLFLLSLCLWMGCMSQALNAVEVTDVLTASEIVGAGYSNRVEYVSKTTNARYVFAANNNESAIQLKNADASGIAVMESPGQVKSITVDIKSAVRGLSVYGSNTPYDSYKKTLSGDDILIANGVLATEKLPVASDCQYFYIRPGGGTAYINSITVVWEVEDVAAPVIYLEEDDLELYTFDTDATFGMTVPGNDSAEIWFTTDGSDPKVSESARLYAEPVRITATTTVKAYAVAAGMPASDVTERTFVKVGSDVVYILDFLNTDDKSTPVRFVGDVIVTGHGADYLFVEDEMGSHLAVSAAEGWGDKRYAVGSRISGFSISHPVDPVQNVDLAQADVSTFGEPAAGDIVIAPTVDSYGLLNESIVLGRVIALTGAVLEINELSRSADGWSIYGVVPVDFSQFGDVIGWPSVAEEGAAYTIKGVVMPDDTGAPVVWPMAISADGDRLSMPDISGRTQFENSTTVSITAVSGADIYYTLDGSDPAPMAGGSTLFYTGPFEITATTTVKAVAVIDGHEPSNVAVAHFVETITTGVDVVDADGIDAIYSVVGGIVAPDGAEIYDSTGCRVAADRVRAGIYVVRFAGRSVKVIVR